MKPGLSLIFLGICLAAGLVVSCAGPHARPVAEAAPSAVWPAPPALPRIAYVQDLCGPRDVGQLPSAFKSLANWITGETGENLKLRRPFAAALDETGGLCLTDTDERMVCYADFAHKKWSRYRSVGKIPFASPVAVTRRQGIFYVADSELGKIFAFREDGRPVFEIGAPLTRPVGLALSGHSLYAVDSQAHAIFVFGLDGKLQFQFGSRGSRRGQFNFPTGIAADSQGRLLVADTMNCRVQIFNADGSFVREFGSNGDSSGHFARPKGVAVDAAGHIYVVDSVFDNFQIFSDGGELLLTVGQRGDGPGGFGLPNGIAISADHRIFVADAYNHRVQIFKLLDPP